MEQTTEKTTPDMFAATGRRKEAVCRATLKPGQGEMVINGRGKENYLCRETLVQRVMAPLLLVEMSSRMDVAVSVSGGGISGQAGAIALAIARALIRYNPEFRSALKRAGFLTVDSRKVERKKYGRPKARKRFQFSKR